MMTQRQVRDIAYGFNRILPRDRDQYEKVWKPLMEVVTENVPGKYAAQFRSCCIRGAWIDAHAIKSEYDYAELKRRGLV